MAKTRKNFASRSMWEPLRGYSRAVQIDDRIFISGTTAVDSNGEVIAPGEPYKQTKFVIEKIREYLASAGLQLSDVVRTRLYVTNLSKWDDYARAHREAFEKIRPASSIVQVTRLVDPRLVIEMEVDAMKCPENVEEIKL